MIADLSVLFLLGVSLVGGALGAWLFQRLRIPQVVGYILAGVVVGESGLRLVGAEAVAALAPVNFFALGIVGFLVGGELEADEMRRHARSYATLLLAEGLGAFVAVAAGVGLFVHALTGDAATAVATAVLLGAIATATDPASTIATLWEARARGLVTATVIAIIALDDALALTLYALAANASRSLLGGDGALAGELVAMVFELAASLGLGVLFAAALLLLLRRLADTDRAFALAVGAVLLVCGLALTFHLDLILAAMAMGMALRNLAGRWADDLFKVLRTFASPIYVLFFVLVGARFHVGAMPWWMWAMVALYVGGSALGKIGGMTLGARAVRAHPAVRRHAGTALLPQGGVAIGLSLVAAQHLTTTGATLAGLPLGEVILSVVTATTLCLQLVGPPLTRWSVDRAGESGRDLTEEDLLGRWTVGDVMTAQVETIDEAESLAAVVPRFGASDQIEFPVVRGDGVLLGMMSLDALRAVIADRDAWTWLIAADAMSPVEDALQPGRPLLDVVRTMRAQGLASLPVVTGEEPPRLIGLLDLADVRRRVTEALLEREGGPADEMEDEPEGREE